MADDWRVKYDAEIAEQKALREEEYGVGNVWTTDTLGETFEVLGFLAPFTVVRRLSDRAKGIVQFDHSPRVYYGFQPTGGQS